MLEQLFMSFALQARHGYFPVVMIGDGATDLEARQEGGADLFIGYVNKGTVTKNSLHLLCTAFSAAF